MTKIFYPTHEEYYALEKYILQTDNPDESLIKLILGKSGKTELYIASEGMALMEDNLYYQETQVNI